jgi:hypothetical protein
VNEKLVVRKIILFKKIRQRKECSIIFRLSASRNLKKGWLIHYIKENVKVTVQIRENADHNSWVLNGVQSFTSMHNELNNKLSLS